MSERGRGGLFNDITQCIGNTPLVQVRRLAQGCQATILCKMENMNPLWSVKDRIARAMIDAAERDGKLGDGTVVIEPTSGNTGIGLAYVCAGIPAGGDHAGEHEPGTETPAEGPGSRADPHSRRRRDARCGSQGRGVGRREWELLHAAAVQEPGEP